MPIEFRCTQCSKLLRTADDTAGKMAKCPSCGLVLTVPSTPGSVVSDSIVPPASPPGPPPTPLGPPPSSSANPPPSVPPVNPYASPAASTLEAPAAIGAVGAGEIRPTIIDVGGLFQRTWIIFKEKFGILVVTGLVMGVVNVVISIGFQMIMFGGMAAGEDLLSILLITAASAGIFIGTIWLLLGYVYFNLKVARCLPAAAGWPKACWGC